MTVFHPDLIFTWTISITSFPFLALSVSITGNRHSPRDPLSRIAQTQSTSVLYTFKFKDNSKWFNTIPLTTIILFISIFWVWQRFYWITMQLTMHLWMLQHLIQFKPIHLNGPQASEDREPRYPKLILWEPALWSTQTSQWLMDIKHAYDHVIWPHDLMTHGIGPGNIYNPEKDIWIFSKSQTSAARVQTTSLPRLLSTGTTHPSTKSGKMAK